MNHTIEGKTILVTGANRGIGRKFVEVFLKRGAAKVYAAVRSLESVQSLIEEFGDRVEALHVDLADPATIEAAARKATDVDIVVNNAGVLKTSGVLAEDTIESLQFELDINLFGLIRVVRAFAPVLARNGGGNFVQLNSVVSLKSFPDFATYSASKAAAYSITQALREDLAKQGTAVHSVHPGPIATDMGEEAGFSDVAEPAEVVADAVIESIASGSFHVFPDKMAKDIGGAYQSFAEGVVESDLSEG